MLSLPSQGLARSVTRHNVDRDVLIDWLEGSVLFLDGEVSKSDVVDTLIKTSPLS